ncbi:uncharacterized protein LOC120022614 isoform X2 [Salvelinus namaycush]|uniref:Uncharacterized protein LOC120022614 isoform X2 n=1 Tax=Salvelinus namaycush TaxID=8040 RepID=A0A8U0TNV1_SALNM|nr:uncharacterized protein LOC120022614 isoform X2 [Salvelinus namaycush]
MVPYQNPLSHQLRNGGMSLKEWQTALDVQLWKLEQRPSVGSMLLRLDFQTDVVPRLVFLKQLGVEDSAGLPDQPQPFHPHKGPGESAGQCGISWVQEVLWPPWCPELHTCLTSV